MQPRDRSCAAASAPPTVTVPTAPAGFVPVAPLDLKGYRPMQSELAAMPDAVAELQTFPDWSSVFGITAPASGQLAQRLQVTAQWTSCWRSRMVSTVWRTNPDPGRSCARPITNSQRTGS